MSSSKPTSSAISESHLKLQAALPCLPGYQFKLEKTLLPNHRKSHVFDYKNSVSVYNTEAPGIGGNPLDGQDKTKIHTSVEIYPHADGNAERVPAWVAFDRKVLRFYGYFQEAVHERREEAYRVRKVNIYFYLEDDTVHVSEPRTQNSGIPQGTLIRRHRLPKQDSENGQHYTVSDFNVGKEVTFYSRTFKISGCDNFTREFLAGIQIDVPANNTIPSDPYQLTRDELLSRMKPTRPYHPKNSLKKFLENDRRVLRFYCIWDDTNSVFGDIRHMILNYFLSDDTIEIREHINANSGRERNTLFLRRCKLPKRRLHSTLGVGSGGSTDDNASLYYNDSDLIIGSVLHLYGRPFVVCDCDGFTREHYREWYGLENFDPVSFDDEQNKTNNSAMSYEHELMPFFTPSITEEDITSPSSLVPNILTHTTRKDIVLASMEKQRLQAGEAGGAASSSSSPQQHTNNNNIVKENRLSTMAAIQGLQQQHQQHPKTDFKKIMLFDGITLRYSARLESTKQIDKDRKFVISLYVSDDTMSVWEPRQRNSGILGGKFIDKKRILKDDLTGFYTAADFYLGATISFFSHTFVITGADDFAIKFMNEHPAMFPKHPRQ